MTFIEVHHPDPGRDHVRDVNLHHVAYADHAPRGRVQLYDARGELLGALPLRDWHAVIGRESAKTPAEPAKTSAKPKRRTIGAHDQRCRAFAAVINDTPMGTTAVAREMAKVMLPNYATEQEIATEMGKLRGWLNHVLEGRTHPAPDVLACRLPGTKSTLWRRPPM